MTTHANAKERIRKRFTEEGAEPVAIDIREFPDEAIFIVTVPRGCMAEAARLGNALDGELQQMGLRGFVTVREVDAPLVAEAAAAQLGVTSEKAGRLISLLAERARTSLIQPSLSYITDTASNLARVMTSRNYLVFGRRGAGKTSLLLEAKRLLELEGHLAVWTNTQTNRNEDAERVFLHIIMEFHNTVEMRLAGKHESMRALELSRALARDAEAARAIAAPINVNTFVTRLQTVVRRCSQTLGRRIFFFLDDFHYLARGQQPILLDLLHGATRDSDAWIKVATIRHLSRWFQPSPPAGLQLGHDAEHVDLDLTLQYPTKAKQFLEEVLRRYAAEVGINSLASIISSSALDRLVLASGAVPRDYLVLCASSLSVARSRDNARAVGQQDVTRAAGVAARSKITELEDDAAANEGESKAILDALTTVRAFCIDERRYTFFRVDFKDKEKHAGEYGVLQSLMDVRLLHLVNPSVSDEHRAGEKSEIYMLDLSQFSGQRMKKNLRVLDFSAGNLLLTETGSGQPAKVGSTPNKLVAILRRGPLLSLNQIETGQKRKSPQVRVRPRTGKVRIVKSQSNESTT